MDVYKRMRIVLNEIPYGNVATYGQIAVLCGKPKNARQIGYALNHGLTGDDAPAHRVVNHKGILSGAAAFDMPDLQQRLLLEEGVEIEWTPEGFLVDLKKYRWKNTMDDALRLLLEFEKRSI